jgi:hypothetical protein
MIERIPATDQEALEFFATNYPGERGELLQGYFKACRGPRGSAPGDDVVTAWRKTLRMFVQTGGDDDDPR